MNTLSALLLVIFVSGCLAQTTTPSLGQFFHCLRKGQDALCSDGTCAADGLSCTCDAGFTAVEDIHCVASADVGTPCDGATTCTEGSCHKTAAGVDVCYCNQQYAGDECDVPRAEVTCTASQMEVSIRPQGTFSGQMYADGNLGVADCELAMDAGATMPTYTKSFSFTSTDPTFCSMTETTLADGISKSYTLKVRVAYNTAPDVILDNDQELAITCTFDKDQEVTSSISKVDATGPQLTQGDVSGSGAPLVFTVYDSTDAVLTDTSEVIVGEQLKLSVALEENEVFTSILVQSCTASNLAATQNADPDYTSLDFVTGSCPADHKVVAGNHALTSPSGQPVVDIPLYAFMFVKGSTDNKNGLHFSCNVLMCPTGSTDCDPPACTVNSAFQTGFGRRKRAADDNMVTLGQSVTVRFGNITLEEELRSRNSASQVNASTCLKHPQMQTIVTILGVALLILLIAFVAVIAVMCRRRFREGKLYDDGRSTSSTQNLSMQIPRPHV